MFILKYDIMRLWNSFSKILEIELNTLIGLWLVRFNLSPFLTIGVAFACLYLVRKERFL